MTIHFRRYLQSNLNPNPGRIEGDLEDFPNIQRLKAPLRWR